MNPYIILGSIGVMALVVIVLTVRSMWREATGTGRADEDAGSKVEKQKNERIRREIEQWREGR